MRRVQVREEAAKAQAMREETVRKALNAFQVGTMALRNATTILYSIVGGRQQGANLAYVLKYVGGTAGLHYKTEPASHLEQIILGKQHN